MIFKQLTEIITGQKVQTRRIVKPGEGWTKALEVAVIGKRAGQVVHTAPSTWQGAIDNIYSVHSGKRMKWHVGQEIAVQPKMYSPAVWIEPDGTVRTDAIYYRPNGINSDTGEWEQYRVDQRDVFRERGYRELRIRITDIRQQRLQDISEEDAIAEGILPDIEVDGRQLYKFSTSDMLSTGHGSAVGAYKHLWNSINTSKKTNWDANPFVWVLNFQVARDGND